MDDFFSSNLFSAMVIGAVSLSLIKLLIAVKRRHRQEAEQEKLNIAIDLYEGDKAAAQVWLSTPEKSLAYKRPLYASVEEVRIVAERVNRGIVL